MKKVASTLIVLQSGLRPCLSAVVPFQKLAHPRDAYLRLDKFHLVEAEEVVDLEDIDTYHHTKVGSRTVGSPKLRPKANEDEEAEEEREGWFSTTPRGGVEAHFGDTECPCIGFDGREGTITVNYSDTKQVIYPADLGSRCETWEQERHPDCLPGGNPGPGKGWCGESWCFVDPCNCKTDVMPQPSDLAPDTTFRGKPLYYSYDACDSKNYWSKDIPNMGKPGCRCVGFDAFPGTTEVDWKDPKTNVTTTVEYPADMGGTCRKWDDNEHPMCKGEGEKPEWCNQRWCYVDPCSCDIDQPPKVTMYQPEATYTGKSLYYSYETCGEEDHFTKELNLEACVNQPTPDKCMRLKVRNGIQKCAWTGTRCLGSELVNHPLCDHLGVKAAWDKHDPFYSENKSKSAGPRAAVANLPLLATLLGAAALLLPSWASAGAGQDGE